MDGVALAIAAAAAVALFRFKAGAIPVIVACALVGMVLRLTGLA